MGERRGSIHIEADEADERAVSAAPRSRVPAIALLGTLALLVVVVVSGRGGDPVERTPAPASADVAAPAPPTVGPDARLDALRTAQAVPASLLAAELFVADPGAETLRALFEAIGGVDGLTLATAEGAFDLVTFHPTDPDQLLAANRSSYGPAENQGVNERWRRTGGVVVQELWAPDVAHDFVHHNRDGTHTVWRHGGGDGFAPRVAEILDGERRPLATSGPLYASRFSSDGGVTFALTGDGDYYSNDPDPLALVADDGNRQTVLADAGGFGWIDHPTTGLLVAYPATADGVTAAWDTETLAPLDGHPLAGRHLRRSVVTGDGARAIAVHADGHLVIIDLGAGRVLDRFGDGIDIEGVHRPLAVDHHGTVAVTVEASGTVTLWWVGDDDPVVRIAADSAQPRWLDEHLAALRTSAVADDAGRAALVTAATGTEPTRWRLVDLDPSRWIDRACELAGRSLTLAESAATGLVGSACGIER
ncbi:MAG: hypothetical protein AAFZ07_05810 [Actinomycetota bacterium]